jgi:hypothetical protein
MVRLAVSTSVLTFARSLRIGQAFTTSGGLHAKTEFAGFGWYKPIDKFEFDEIREATYIVYSYDTPIAWKSREGAWFKNATHYSATTTRHQRKIFDAINELS